MSADKNWIYQTNIYEVNLRQYTTEGTFRAFSEHLPRLRDMGVETLWFMPITPISLKERKGTLGSYYACSDYTSINPEFGTMDDFKALVLQAHGMGFYVIIDWVANHTGWDHHWTTEHPDWYEHDAETRQFKRASGMHDIIELDFKNPDLRAAMIEAMSFWINHTGIDGFRCDLAFWVELEFWLEAIPRLNAIRPLFWLAEMDALEHIPYMQVFDAAYTWSWMHQTKSFYEGNYPLKGLSGLLTHYQAVPGLLAWFTTNHDENTWNGSEYEKYGPAAPVLAVHSCTWPGIPLIYSGQEMPNYKRLEFFDKDVIPWTGRYELHDFYKTLFNLHRHHPALDARTPVFLLKTSDDGQLIAYLRRAEKEQVMVWLNLSDKRASFELQDSWLGGHFRDVFSGVVEDLSQTKNFVMEPWSYRVFTCEV